MKKHSSNLSREIIKLACQVNAFVARHMVLIIVEVLGTLCRRYHVDDLVVASITKLHVVPLILLPHHYPVFRFHIWPKNTPTYPSVKEIDVPCIAQTYIMSS